MLNVLFAAIVAAQAAPVADQPAAPTEAAQPQAAPAAPCCIIKALTPVRLAITNPLASNAVSTGQLFAFTLAAPILLDGGRSIPAGTPGQGEIVHAAHSGMAGKAGELVLAARYLDYQGVRIPLRSMRFGKGGKDQTGTANAVLMGTAVVAPIASIFALAITGGEVRIPAGAIAEAKISADTQVDASRLAAPAPSPVLAPAAPPTPPSAPIVSTNSTSEGIVK